MVRVRQGYTRGTKFMNRTLTLNTVPETYKGIKNNRGKKKPAVISLFKSILTNSKSNLHKSVLRCFKLKSMWQRIKPFLEFADIFSKFSLYPLIPAVVVVKGTVIWGFLNRLTAPLPAYPGV